MTSTLDELLALDVLGLLEPGALGSPAPEDLDARAEFEAAATLLALAVEPVAPTPGARQRLVDALTRHEPLAPFVDRVAALFDLGRARVREILDLFGQPEGWTPIFPGAAFYDLDGGPALGEATAGLVRIAAGSAFPRHVHRGEERVFVLQGAFVDSCGRRVAAGELVVMPDGSEHGFAVDSAHELLYAVVVRQIEFEDGTRAP